MNRFYIAVQIEENEKYYAYVIPVSDMDNLLSKLKIKGILTANICHTKKAAYDLANYWNETHKANNRYMFDEPRF